MKPRRISRVNPFKRVSFCFALTATIALLPATLGQEIIFQEGFNDDGDGSRYSMTGRDTYELDRIVNELNNSDQRGPIYWDHSSEISFIGVPQVPGRRMVFSYSGANDASVLTDDFLEIFENAMNWLIDGKQNAQIIVAGNVDSIGGLADRLEASGHTLLDDPGDDELEIEGDLFIHGPGSSNPSRFVGVPKPVIVMLAGDHDDMLTGSIGSARQFEPQDVRITAPDHPAAAGKSGSFPTMVEGQSGRLRWELTGLFRPNNSTVLATVDHIVRPRTAVLGDVDEYIEGTKASAKQEWEAPILDIADGSAGNWDFDEPLVLPGNGSSDTWGLHATGKLKVTNAGTYSFAIGTDDGGKLRIDTNQNGLDADDPVLEDLGPHGFLILSGDFTFESSGTFDFEVMSYDSGGDGGLEVWVSNIKGGNTNPQLDSGDWDILGEPFGNPPVTMEGAASMTTYIAVGEDTVLREPLIVLINGPEDDPPGESYGGGAFAKFEGKGFIAGSGMNKWSTPGAGYRTLRLNPVNVEGKENLKLTVALAATQIDIETGDILHIYAYPDGEDSRPVRLANFHGVANGTQPWFADEMDGFTRRLTKDFADFTYDLPENSKNVIIEFRAITTWWNEILAIDNVRITEGAPDTELAISIAREGADIVINYSGTLKSSGSLTGEFNTVDGANPPTYKVNASEAQQFFIVE